MIADDDDDDEDDEDDDDDDEDDEDDDDDDDDGDKRNDAGLTLESLELMRSWKQLGCFHVCSK